MALIDKASLLMVPSTYEAGKLYNVLPSGNRAPDNKGGAGYDQTRADFDFDRGSNAAASRINSSGLIEKYRENLLTESNNFSDSDWNKNASGSFTSGQEGYNGSNDAWKFNVTTASNSGAWQNITFSGVATFSAYFKKGTLDKIGFTNYAGSGYECWFDLTNGTIGQQTGDLIDAKIEAIGTNGWYRCSITDVGSGANYFQLKPSNAYSGTSTAGHIFIQSAQVESGLVATDYLNSTTTTGKAGVLIDLPRINFDANGENGALLLEPSRQQLIQFSEYIGASYWTKSNLSVATNNAISPSGLQDSNLVTLSAGTSVKQFYSGTFTAITNAYAFSGFFKKGTHNFIQLLAGGTDIVNFDLTLGTYNSPTSTLGDIEDYGNGWYRCTMLASGASSSITIGNIMAVDSLSSVRAQSTASTGSFSVWGLQIESGASYQSSYIPNHSGTGGVTRAADSCSVTGASDVIGQTEGTLFFDVNISHVVGNEALGGINSGAYANHATIQRIGNTFQFVRNSATQSGATIVTSATISAGRYKLAIAYKSGDTACFLNGTQVSTTQTQTFTNASLSVVRMSGDAIGALPISDSYKQAILFKERLSNAELATLTTL